MAGVYSVAQVNSYIKHMFNEDFVLNNSKVNQCSSSTSSTSLEEKSYDLERKRGHCHKRFKRADELRKEVHTLSQSMNYRKLKRNVLSSL